MTDSLCLGPLWLRSDLFRVSPLEPQLMPGRSRGSLLSPGYGAMERLELSQGYLPKS